MAHFYGTIKGARGEASRLGSKNSGLRVTAASWSGAVRVELSVKDGRDWATIELTKWQGHGVDVDRLLYEGPVDGSEWFTSLQRAG